MVLLDSSRLGGRVDPLWWRVPVWAGLTAYTVVQANGTGARIATGVLMGAGAAALQLARHADVRLRIATLLFVTGAGTAACLIAHKGVAELLVVVAAARAPYAVEGLLLMIFTVADAVLFGVTVAVISDSLPGLLAGFAVPALVQRTREHLELVRERDRAQALLAEAQAARESEAQTAALRERGRIARELHDVLAHSLAGLSMQLQGVRATAAREQVPASVLTPLDAAADLARAGLTEARAAVSSLRDPAGLGLAALPGLVARHPGDAQLLGAVVQVPLSPDADHALYRAVQESLTNAARYAPGSPVTIAVDESPGRVRVTVDDSGPAPGRVPVADEGSGLGLAGMTERIQQVGGQVDAGPRPTGGWRVHVEIPVAP